MSDTENPDEAGAEQTPVDRTLAGPDQVAASGRSPATPLEESDPSADSREGLAGDMGVSSERTGPVRGLSEEVTYGAAETHPASEEDAPSGQESEQGSEQPPEQPPEQSAYDRTPEVNPAGLGRHESDPEANPGHGT
jgi:hypothetical protein